MTNDRAYEYFFAAFEDWLAALEAAGKAVQKELADILKINKSTSHRYIKKDRNIPFDRQVMIANSAGFEYIDFLLLGKKKLEGDRSKNIYTLDQITKDHLSIIPQFTHKKDAYDINTDLLEVDQHIPEKIPEVKGFIKGILTHIDEKEEDSRKAGTNQGRH